MSVAQTYRMYQLAKDAADQLRGTCRTLADIGPEFKAAQDDRDFCAELDSEVFCCSCCNWWLDVDEESAYREGVCDECFEDDKDEE